MLFEMRRCVQRHLRTAERSYLALGTLELSVAVEEARQLNLRQPLTLFQVAETPSVKLTLCLARLGVHLCHNALDQLQLKHSDFLFFNLKGDF